MDTLWAFLSDPDNQQTLAWLGGGLVVVAGGLWAVVKFFFPRSSGGKPTSRLIRADRGSIVAGRDISIGGRHGLSGIEVALLVAIVIGGLLLVLAFAGTRISVENGVGVGGNVEDSTISIERSGSAEP